MSSTSGGNLITNGAASSNKVAWQGGMGVMTVVGTFSGATIKLQFVGPDGSTLVDAGAGTTFTAAGAGVFYLPPCPIQVTITGGPPSGIYASVARVPS